MGSELNKALAAVQKELAPIKRNAKGQTGTREHRYADLAGVSAEVLPLLSKHGLAFSARPTMIDGQFVLAYSLLHTSGEREDGEYPLGTGTPQQLGSAITYARRYCLCAVTGAAPVGEDDDGAAASEAPVNRPRARPVRSRTTGPDHERLRAGAAVAAPGDRLADRGPLPPEEDHWTGQPAGKLPHPPNGKIGVIQQHFKRLGITDRDVRLGYTAQLAELHGLASSSDLTDEQAKRVLDRIGKCRDEKALRALLDRGDAPAEETT